VTSNVSDGSSEQPLKEGFRPIGGAIYGVVAFFTSFVVTTGYFTYRASEVLKGGFDLEEVFPTPHFVGFPFYNAHMVETPIDLGAIDGSTGGVDSYFVWFNRFVADAAGAEINTLVFNAIPAIVLLVTGYVIASRAAASLSVKSNAAAGASVAVGYLPLFVLGTQIFRIEKGGSTAGPELGVPLLFFGALFTVGFGGLGGYLSGKRAE